MLLHQQEFMCIHYHQLADRLYFYFKVILFCLISKFFNFAIFPVFLLFTFRCLFDDKVISTFIFDFFPIILSVDFFKFVMLSFNYYENWIKGS